MTSSAKLKDIEWKDSMYDPLHVLPEDQANCKRLAQALVHECLRSYDIYDASTPRAIDENEWKFVKGHGDISIYRERHPSMGPKENSALAATEWKPPVRMVGVGTLRGTIDDILYGITASDVSGVIQNRSYSRVQTGEAQVLAAMELPTPDQPFRHLGFKWILKPMPMQMRRVINARDLVYLDYIGIMRRENGERIGFHVRHSVDLPTVPELVHRHIIRARTSACSLFFQDSHDTIGFFTTGVCEGNGKLLNQVTARATADAMMICRMAVPLANDKKLLWLLRRKKHEGHVAPQVRKGDRRCRGCTRKVNPLRKPKLCDLCDALVCPQCRQDKAVLDAIPPRKVRKKDVVLCKRCMQEVAEKSAFKIAREEVVAGRYEYVSRAHREAQTTEDWVSMESVDQADSPGRDSCEGEEVVEEIVESLRPSLTTTLSLSSPSSYSADMSGIRSMYSEESSSAQSEQGGGMDLSELTLERKEREEDMDMQKRRQLWLEVTQMRLAEEEAYLRWQMHESD